MIYLDKNTQTMFHTEEKCKDYIVQNMYECDVGYFSENDYVQQKVIDMLGYMLIDNSDGAEKAYDKLVDIVNEWKEETINCDYDEAEDYEEESLIVEGYIWGD